MEINKLMKSIFWIFMLVLLSVSCKKNQKKVINFSANSSQNIEINKTTIDFVRDFYISYLTDLNENTTKCVLKKYLSENLINSIEKLDYNPIIDAQDYNKFDLRELKVSKTDNKDIYRVTFINMNKEVIIDVKIAQKDNLFKIIALINKKISIPYNLGKNNSSIDDLDVFFSYYIEPDGDPRTAITYIIENFDSTTTIFKKESYDNAFEYECTKQKKDSILSIYYKTTISGEDYNSNEPLIRIYNKNNIYYAISPIIENGKEIKLIKE